MSHWMERSKHEEWGRSGNLSQNLSSVRRTQTKVTWSKRWERIYNRKGIYFSTTQTPFPAYLSLLVLWENLISQFPNKVFSHLWFNSYFSFHLGFFPPILSIFAANQPSLKSRLRYHNHHGFIHHISS